MTKLLPILTLLSLPLLAETMEAPRQFRNLPTDEPAKLSFQSLNQAAQIHVKAYRRQPGTHFKDALALADHDTEQGKRLLNAKITPAQRVNYDGRRGFQFTLEWSLQNRTTKLEEIILEEAGRLVTFTLLADANAYNQYYASFINTVKNYRPEMIPTQTPLETVTDSNNASPLLPPVAQLKQLQAGNPQTTYLRREPLVIPIQVAETETYVLRATNFGQIQPTLALYDQFGRIQRDSVENNQKRPGFYIKLYANRSYRLIVSTNHPLDLNQPIGLSLTKYDPDQDIRLIYAHYGNHNGFRDVTDLVQQQRTSNFGSLRVKNSSMGGDPVSGVKQLTLLLETPLGRYEKVVREGQRLYFSELEDFDKLTPSKQLLDSEITITKATYGSTQRYRDVTDRVLAELKRGETSILARNRDMGGDPHSGAAKKLIIEVTTPFGTFKAETPENQVIYLSQLSNPEKLIPINGAPIVAPIYKPTLPGQSTNQSTTPLTTETSESKASKPKEVKEETPKQEAPKQAESLLKLLDLF